MQPSLFVIICTLAVVSAYPGLLKVPRIYNALIKTDQNLAPSRAFPVLQPVVQRKALGYVPPFYYPQFSPQFIPGFDQGNFGFHLPQPFGFQIPDVNPQPKLISPESEEGAPIEDGEAKDKTPVKFYPNYETLMNDPHFYSVSGLGSHADQATYEDQGAILDPIPPEGKGDFVELLPNFQDEKASADEGKGKIPDVPPPPVPTSPPEMKTTKKN